jgi:hypothetical protein
MARRGLPPHKKLCADVLGNDFDLTKNKFSYTRLKELETKVPKFSGDLRSAKKDVPGDTNCTRLRLASTWQANCHKFQKVETTVEPFRVNS